MVLRFVCIVLWDEQKNLELCKKASIMPLNSGFDRVQVTVESNVIESTFFHFSEHRLRFSYLPKIFFQAEQSGSKMSSLVEPSHSGAKLLNVPAVEWPFGIRSGTSAQTV